MDRDTSPTPPSSPLPPGGPESDALLRLLKDFESGVGSMKVMYEQRQVLQNQLSEREAQLASKDQELRAQASEIEGLKGQLAARQNELLGAEQSLRERREQLAKDRTSLEDARRTLQADIARHEAHMQRDVAESSLRRKEMDASEASLLREREDLAQRAAELARRHDELEATAAGLHEREREAAVLSARLDETKRTLDSRQEELAKQASAHAAQQESLRTLGATLQRQQEELTDRLRVTEKQGKEIESQRAVLNEQRSRQEQQERSLREREGELQRLRTDLEQRELRTQTLDKSVGERQALQARIDEVTKEATGFAEAARTAEQHATEIEAECERRLTDMLHQLQSLQLHMDEQAVAHQGVVERLQAAEKSLNETSASLDVERARSAEITRQTRERLEQMRRELETNFERRLEREKAELRTSIEASLVSKGPRPEDVERLVGQRLAQQAQEWEREATRRIEEESTARARAQLEAARSQWEQDFAAQRDLLEREARAQREAALEQQRADLEQRFALERSEASQSGRAQTEAAQHALLEKWRVERTKLEEAAQRDMALALDQQLAALESEFRSRWEAHEQELQRGFEQRQSAALTQAREHSAAALAQQKALAQQEMQHAVEHARLAAQRSLEEQSARQREQAIAQAHAVARAEGEEALRSLRAQHHQQMESLRKDLQEKAAQERDALLQKFEERLRDELAAIDASSVLGAESTLKLQREQMEESFKAQLEHAIMTEKARVQREVESVMAVLEEYEQLWHLERHESAKLFHLHDQARQEAQEADHVVGVLREKLREELSSRQAMSGQVEEHAQKSGELQLLVEDLRAQLARARERSSQVRSDAYLVEPTTVSRRRKRLRQMRAVIKARSEKLRAGTEALSRRVEQCEVVLRNRAELSTARDRVIEGERRLQSRMASGKTGVLMLCLVGTFAVVGLLSWAIAKQVAPATYVATSMIAADGRGRTLMPNDLAEWEKYHVNVLKDPRFHQMASDRFQRAGMESLGNPGAVTKLIEDAVRSEPRNTGELKLHLTMQGRRKAERTLDTLTASLTAFANTSQIQRIDGSVTKVADAADTGNEPVDNAQTYYALTILGSLLAVIGITSMVVWHRLARAKSAFERDTQLSGILDDAHWGGADALEQFKTPQGRSPDKKQAA